MTKTRVVRTAALCILSLAAAAGCQSGGAGRTPPAARAQLFEGMGPHSRAVTTTSPEAQRWIDQGLAWIYEFNHDEAIRSFERAAVAAAGR